MYKYYKIQYLNEAKLVAVPLFAVKSSNEHNDVLRFALNSKQVKTSQNVDYILEVSENEYEGEFIPENEGDYGDAPDNTENSEFTEAEFDEVQDSISGLKKPKPKTLQNKWKFLGEGRTLNESLNSFFEGEDPANFPDEDFEDSLKASLEDENLNKKVECCPKCNGCNINKLAGDYLECNDCFNHWKKLYENTTADMSVSNQPAFGGDRNRIEDLNPYGEETESEYIKDEEVLQEKFEKFALKNCQDAKSFVKKGKFQLKEFLSLKSYGYRKLLEENFIASLNEEETTDNIKIEDVEFETDNVVIIYYKDSDDESDDLTVTKDEFFDFLESKDPSWEDFYRDEEDDSDYEGEDFFRDKITIHDTDAYWSNKSFIEQKEIAIEFLKSKGIE